MGYCEYLKAMLNPLGVYNVLKGYGAAELTALGKAFDICCEETEELEKEIAVQTASSYGVDGYAELFFTKPAYTSLDNLRNAIKSLMQVGEGSFTVDSLNSILSGCGISAVVSEGDEWYTVNVSFPDMEEIPENIDEIKERIEQILPCHLGIVYVGI